MKKRLLLILVSAWCGTVLGANRTYTGLGTDPNNWSDTNNWNTAVPTTGDNALFLTSGKNMQVSQAVPEFGSLYVGYNGANMVTLAAGCVMINSGQTVCGLGNNAKGTLVIDGGSLVNLKLVINTSGAPNPQSSTQVKSGSLEAQTFIQVGVSKPATLEISGGTTEIGTDLLLTEGWLNIVGDEGILNVGGIFKFGTASTKATEVAFKLGANGGVSTISADSIEFLGVNNLVIDGANSESDAEVSLVLIDLATGTFSAGDLALLNDALDLVNMSSGSLSLADGGHQLVFTGKPVPRTLIKAWEFNTLGDTEGWDTGANGQFVGVDVADAINGSERVLTCSDVSGTDPQLIYNDSLAEESAITPGSGQSWRTAEIRLRQISANPDEAGVASRLFDPGSTLITVQSPFRNFFAMINDNINCSVRLDSDNWIIVTYDISAHGVNDLNYLRIDPIGGAVNTNANFEIDYVRVYAGPTQPPIVEKLAQAWEFNTLGDTEGWYGINMTGLTASNTIEGSELVLTAASTASDPMCHYTNTVSVGEGSWTELQFRARQLIGNPGDPGVTYVTNWSAGGTVAVIQGKVFPTLSSATAGVTITPDTNGWVIGTIDLSSFGPVDLDSIRLDFSGVNFEADYIRIFKNERQTDYEYWASLNSLSDTNAASGADPDEDTFSNFYEYCFGGDPNNGADVGVLPLGNVVNSGGSNVLEYVYFRNSSPYSGLTYSLEGKTNLVTPWGTITHVETGVGSYSSGLEAVTNQVPMDSAAKFIRTKVLQ